MVRRRTFGVLALLGALALGVGCGGSSGGSSDGAAEGTTSTTAPTGATMPPRSTTTTEPSADAPVASAGCKLVQGEAKQEDKVTIDVDGVERWYLLTAPKPTEDRPRPLIVDYHGLSEGANVHAQMTGLSKLAPTDGFVVAFPQGIGTPVGWAARTDDDSHGDQKFTAALLDEIEAKYCIDTSRVYATGLSNGAFMSSSVACSFADRFAAVAPVAGLQALTPCPAKRPVPVLTFHGTADPILLFNGGVDGDYLGSVLAGEPVVQEDRPYDIDGPGYPQAVADWAKRNGCDPTAKDTNVTKTVIHRVYPCPAGADVELYIVIGGGHSWPGSAFSASIAKIVGPTTMDIDASALIWTFFQRFHLPAT